MKESFQKDLAFRKETDSVLSSNDLIFSLLRNLFGHTGSVSARLDDQLKGEVGEKIECHVSSGVSWKRHQKLFGREFHVPSHSIYKLALEMEKKCKELVTKNESANVLNYAETFSKERHFWSC